MSVNLYSASGSGGNDAVLQSTTVGGSKPLHRFIRGQPKIVGTVVLILGLSYIIVSIAVNPSFALSIIWAAIPPGYLLGSLFSICGILFILTEHNPTKKKVTTSLALSIMTTLGAAWSLLHMIPNVIMEATVVAIFSFYSSVGIIIFIVMSSFAGAALRSPKSQAVVVMTAAPAETPVE